MTDPSRHSILFTWIVDMEYILPAYLSVRSFVNSIGSHVERTSMLVLIAGPYDDAVLSQFRELSPKIEVRELPVMETEINEPTITNRRHRISVVQEYCVRMPVFLVDADTIFTKDISILFPIVQSGLQQAEGKPIVFGVTEHRRIRDATLYFRKEPGIDLTDVLKNNIYRSVWGEDDSCLDLVQFNCGFIGFYNCLQVVKGWESGYVKGLQNPMINPADDQVPLAVSMHRNGALAFCLPDALNSKGALVGSYALYHAWGGKWLDELKVCFRGGISFTDFGRHYRELLNHTPSVLIDSFFSRHEINHSGPLQYMGIDGNFSFEKEYFNYLSNTGGKASITCLEIGSYSNGKGLAYLIELVKNNFSEYRIFSHILNLNKNAVLQNIQRAGLQNSVEFIESLEEIPDAALDFAFIESDLHYQKTRQLIDQLQPKMRSNAVIGGYDFTGMEYHLEEKEKLIFMCREKNLSLCFGHKCFLIRFN